MLFRRFHFLKVVVISGLVGCTPTVTTVEEAPPEEPLQTLELDYERSLITWIGQGDELLNGSVKVDTGSIVLKGQEEMAVVGLITGDLSFGNSDTVDHFLQIELTDIVTYDTTLLTSAVLNDEFKINQPTHLGQITLHLRDSIGPLMIPMRISRTNSGIELEGKVSIDSKVIDSQNPWELFHVGFLLHTDKIE